MDQTFNYWKTALSRELSYVRRHSISGPARPTAIVTQLARVGGGGGGGGGPAGSSSGRSWSQGGSGRSGGNHSSGSVVLYDGGGGGSGGGSAGGGKATTDFMYYSESSETEDDYDDDFDDDYDDDEDHGAAGGALGPTSGEQEGRRRSRRAGTLRGAERRRRRKGPQGDRISRSLVDSLTAREVGLSDLGGGRLWTQQLSTEYGTRHILANSIFREVPASVPGLNKVFCSQWLSDRQVVFGTKCNKLMVYDVNSRFMDQIPSLHSSENSVPPDQECGIHAVEINPSRTLLATGAKNSNDIAIYRLPTLDPVCVGESAHRDWIFDITWLDDQFLVSGSRDGTVALWRITDDLIEEVISCDVPSFLYVRPLALKVCKTADRVRSLCFNVRKLELVAISTNGYIHLWDGTRFKQLMSKRLPHNMENVCLSVNDEDHLYAVGSKAHTDLLDARTLQAVRKIQSRNSGCGIRSVSFRGNILTIGTGIGIMLFWDMRAGKFLESTMNSNRAVQLKASKGWQARDDHYMQHPMDDSHKYLPAIYTHCYDASGIRLFAAGGPLQSQASGNYLALFQ